MSHLFISYARENRPEAAELAALLEANGYKVWWDTNLIAGGDFRAAIRQHLVDARKVIVLWSAQSVVSGFVIDEANEAKRLRKLIPICLNEATPPYGFGDLHTISTVRLRDDVRNIIAAVEDKSLPLPAAARQPTTRLISEAALSAATIVACIGGIFFALAMHVFFLLGLLVLLYVGLAAGIVLAAVDRPSLGAAFLRALVPSLAVPLAYIFYLAARVAANYIGNYSAPTVLMIPGGSGGMLPVDQNIVPLVGAMSVVAFLVSYVLVSLFSVCFHPVFAGITNHRTRLGVSLLIALVAFPVAFATVTKLFLL